MRYLYILFFILFTSQFVFAQPGNDNCASATAITWNGGCVTGTTASATSEAGEDLTCLAGGPQTVWYSFVAANDTAFIKTTAFASGGCVMRYTIYGPNPTCQPSGGSCSGNVTDSDIEWTGFTVGATYYIQVIYPSGGACGASASYCIGVYDPLMPEEDWGSTCDLAHQFYVSNTCWDVPSGNTAAVTCNWTPTAGLDQSCSAANDATQCGFWAKFTANSTSTTIDLVDFNGAGATDYWDVTLYTGSCGSLTEVNCTNVDKKSNAYSVTTTVGTEYYMLITTGANYSGSLMNASVCGAACTVPSNDNCGSAIPISDGVTYTGTNACATADEALCSGSTENNIWYSWTAPAGWPVGQTAFIVQFDQDCYLHDATSPSSGSQLSLYNATETCATITGGTSECMVYHNPNNDNNTYATFVPVAGSTYLINFDGFGGDACTFSFQVNDSPILPIKLLSFGAMFNSSTREVDISWSTETEVNNDYFTIEKSKDGVIFEVVDVVTGAGNSTTRLNYNIQDEKPFEGLSYYRLKQTDYDGTYTYSNSVFVNVKNTFEDVNVYPNPLSGNGYLTFSSLTEGEQSVMIYDVSGRVVYQDLIAVKNGDNKVTLYTESLSKGMYFIKLGESDIAKNIKLIKE